MPALLLIIGSPILLIIVLTIGILNLSPMIIIMGSPYVLGAVLLLNSLFLYQNRLGVFPIVTVGAVVGFVFWLMGILAFYASPIGQLCGIPLIGQLACGTVTAASILTSLFGYLVGGVVLSGIIGGLMLLLFKR